MPESTESTATGPTWPENAQERSDFSDWQYEAANGDTVLGFRDWVTHRNEQIDETDPLSFDEIAEAQGWNTTTMLTVCRDYISTTVRDCGETLGIFAQQVADDENA